MVIKIGKNGIMQIKEVQVCGGPNLRKEWVAIILARQCGEFVLQVDAAKKDYFSISQQFSFIK